MPNTHGDRKKIQALVCLWGQVSERENVATWCFGIMSKLQIQSVCFFYLNAFAMKASWLGSDAATESALSTLTSSCVWEDGSEGAMAATPQAGTLRKCSRQLVLTLCVPVYVLKPPAHSTDCHKKSCDFCTCDGSFDE